MTSYGLDALCWVLVSRERKAANFIAQKSKNEDWDVSDDL